MYNLVINNEAAGGLDLPPFLINNPIFRGDKAMTETILTKICPKCKVEKTLDEFFKDKTHIDGRTSVSLPMRGRGLKPVLVIS